MPYDTMKRTYEVIRNEHDLLPPELKPKNWLFSATSIAYFTVTLALLGSLYLSNPRYDENAKSNPREQASVEQDRSIAFSTAASIDDTLSLKQVRL